MSATHSPRRLMILPVVAFVVLGCWILAGCASLPAAARPAPTHLPFDTTRIPGGSAVFVASTDAGYDPDHNGRFEYLQVSIEMEVAQAGAFAFTSGLTGPNGEFVTSGELFPDPRRTAPLNQTNLALGRQVVRIYFSGQSIRAKGIDGPYTLRILMADSNDQTRTASFSTGPYTYRDFQE